MNYIGLMNQMWRSAMKSPMPASEIALFAYLVNECNKRFWQMPFACSTTRISDDLRVSRQTVITAREHLVKRRLISFTEGKSRHLPSTQQIREHYGDRIADRLNEMVKKIVFSNGTYRTDKLATSG